MLLHLSPLGENEDGAGRTNKRKLFGKVWFRSRRNPGCLGRMGDTRLCERIKLVRFSPLILLDLSELNDAYQLRAKRRNSASISPTTVTIHIPRSTTRVMGQVSPSTSIPRQSPSRSAVIIVPRKRRRLANQLLRQPAMSVCPCLSTADVHPP